MNVLLTGGSGFLGRYFHAALIAAGDQVTVLDLVRPAWDPGPTRIVQGDVRNTAKVREALRGCDAILHLAAAHHDFGIARETYFSVNEQGARVLVAEAAAAGVSNICFFSSVAVYGSAPEPRTEESPTAPVSAYGQSKLAAERVLLEWASGGPGRRCLVIRPTVVFGPGNLANMYSLIRQVDSGWFVRVGAGRNVKSLSYVENIVPATLYLWGRPPPSAFEIYNYVDKPDVETKALLGRVYRGLDRRLPGWHVPQRLAVALLWPFEILAALAGRAPAVSIERIRKMCAQTRFEAGKVRAAGFAAPVPLLEGVDRMVAWYLGDGRHLAVAVGLPPAELRSSRPARPARYETGEEG